MEDTNFVDTESSYSGNKDSISFQQIVLKHLFSISKFASVEMRGGYWQKKVIPINNSLMTTEEYISDSREVYSNSVKHLHDLLLPYFDKEMSSNAEEYNKQLITINEAMTCFIKDIPEELNIREFKNDNFEAIYKKKKYTLSRSLFQKLSLFLKRNGYLQTKDLEVGD